MLLRLCKALGKTPSELLDGLSSEEFSAFIAAEVIDADDDEGVVEEMAPGDFLKRAYG